MRKRVLRVAIAWLLGWTAGASLLAGGISGFEGGIDTTDNVTRAVFDEDRESEAWVYVQPTGGWRFQPGTNQSVFVTGRVRLAQATSTNELGSYAPGVAVLWQSKTRLGADAPRFLVEIRVDRLGFDSRIRRGWSYDASLGYSTPVGKRWRLAVEASGNVRDADAEAFTQDAVFAELRAERQIGGRWLIDLGFLFRDGDVTSTATPAAIDPRVVPILAASTARIDDDAFPGKIAYRLDARSYRLDVGANIVLAATGALDVRVLTESTDAGAGIDYRVSGVRAAWMQRF